MKQIGCSEARKGESVIIMINKVDGCQYSHCMHTLLTGALGKMRDVYKNDLSLYTGDIYNYIYNDFKKYTYN